MSSNLRVDRILPSTGTEVGVGTATGSVALYGDVNIAGTLTYEDVTNIDSVGIVTARSDIYLGNDIYLTDGSSGYEKVEIDSNDIRVEHKHIHSEFGFWTRSAGVTDRRNGIDGDNNDLRLYSNSTEKVRITSAGNVGINKNNPAAALVVYDTAGSLSSTKELTAEFRRADGTYNPRLQIRHSSEGTDLNHTWSTNAGNFTFSNGDTEVLRITSDGKVAIGFNAPAVAGLSISNSSTNRGFEFDTGSGFDSTSCIRAYDRPTTAYKSLGLTGSDIKFGINDVEKVRISSGGLAINKNAAADAEIEIVQSADPTLRLHDNRNAAYKADFMMAGSAPLIRNNNTTASDRTLTIQKGTTDHLIIHGNGAVCIGSGYQSTGGGQLTIRGLGVNSYAVQDYQYVGTPSSNNTLSQIRFTANTSGSSVIGGARIQAAADADWSATGDAPTRLQFYTTPNGSASQLERLRITSDGEVLISNNTNRFLSLDRTNANNGTGEFNINVEINSQTSISYDDGAPLVIGTSSSPRTQAGFTERLRIASNGRVGVNDSTSGYAEALQVTSHSSYNQYCLALKIQSNSGTFARFSNGTTAPCGSITSSGGNNTSFNQSGSDIRLKKNFETWDEEVLPHFKSLQPKKFNFTNEDDGTEKTKGFVAQDNVSNFPEAYPLTDNPETNETRYMYNPSGMVIYLMKALQEEIAKREALEARITALEG